MKTCPTCGIETDDRFLFCPDDGSDLGKNQAYAETSIDESSGPARRLSVLYCPACEGEYPLTFSSCPIDGLRLTRERVRFRGPGQAGFNTQVVGDVAALFIPTTRINQEPSDSDPADVRTAPDKTASAHYDSIDVGVEETGPEYDYPEVERELPGGLIERIRNDRPSFKIAAIATMIGLALFGLAAVYRLYTYGARKPAPSGPSATVETPQQSQPSYFIDTPKEAREYAEETASSEEAPGKASSSSSENAGTVTARSREDHDQVAGQSQKTQAPLSGRADAARSIIAPPPAQRAVRQGAEGAVEVRLIRIRASRSQSGYRYDLTFNMRESGGRQVRWDKLTISARSSSGLNHLQALPFDHRLVASSALTFTVSVEMTGRTDPDWRGRLVCTTVGADNMGRPVRATFGAALAP